MFVDELRVLNYRSVRTQQTVPLRNGAVLVGPNNVGKSNLLRAVELFFQGAADDSYDIEVDLPYRNSGRTSLRAMFTFEDDDQDLWSEFVALHEIVGEDVADEMKVPIYLEFSRAGNGSYKLFPSKKPERSRQSEFSRRQGAFVQAVLASFTVRYVPSAKDWKAFFEQFLVPALGEVIEDAIAEQLDGVRNALEAISESLGNRLESTLDDRFSLELGLADNLSSVLGSVSIQLKDPTPTDLAGKGQGIQSAFLITAIGWISERERQGGRVPIWLLEEPEAYTHPSLARAVVQLVDEARAHGPVVFTTHSLGLVPADVSLVLGVERGEDGTAVRTYASHGEATHAIREALGVKAADYFGFGTGAVLTEGPSDRGIIKWYLDLVDTSRFPNLRMAALHDYGGVKQLSGFVLGTLGVLQPEAPVVSLFDGDTAGEAEVRMLSRRLPKAGVRWAPNLDYVMLSQGREIEGVFPDTWIIEMHRAHPGWFSESVSLDMDGHLLGFKIKDSSKQQARSWLQARGELRQAELFTLDRLVTALEDALTRQKAKLVGERRTEGDGVSPTSASHPSAVEAA